MTESLNTWLARLAPEPLPVMRRTLTRVRDLLDRPSASHSNLKQVIEFDPGFALHIFREINDLPNPTKEPITKLGNAIPLLGMRKIEQALERLPALEARLQGPPRRHQLDCYSRAAHASIYAVELARRLHLHDPETLSIAALLHDLGEMALGSAAPELMRKIRRLVQQGEDPNEAALQVLGFSLESLSQQLSGRWGLPELVQTAQEPHNSFLSRPLTVMLACAVARDSAVTWCGQEIADHVELLAEFLEISPEQAQAQLHQNAARAAQRLQGLTLPLPAFRLAYGSQPLPEPQPPPEAKVSQPAPKPSVETAGEPPPAVAQRPAPSPNPMQQKLLGIVDAMQQHGLANVMFSMLSTDKTRLTARLVRGDRAETGLRGFEIDLQSPHLFSLMMKKPQAVWLNPANREKYQGAIPEDLSRQLCTKGFLAMSIFIKNKPLGLFYADNGCGRTLLSGGQYQNFKALCLRFMREIA